MLSRRYLVPHLCTPYTSFFYFPNKPPRYSSTVVSLAPGNSLLLAVPGARLNRPSPCAALTRTRNRLALRPVPLPTSILVLWRVARILDHPVNHLEQHDVFHDLLSRVFLQQ